MKYGPCEDDYEFTCPFIGILPDESECEDGSPINLRHVMEPNRRIGYDEEPLEDEAFYAHIFDD